MKSNIFLKVLSILSICMFIQHFYVTKSSFITFHYFHYFLQVIISKTRQFR